MHFRARNSTLPAAVLALLAVAACGDDKGTTATAATSVSGDMITSVTTVPVTTDPGTTTGASSTGGALPDTTTGDTTTGDTSTTGESTTTTDASTTDVTASTTSSESTGVDTDATDKCVGHVEDPNDICSVCGCLTCLEHVQACEADPGCMEIWACMKKYHCEGIECLGYCGEQFNKYGGLGTPTVMRATDRNMCMNTYCSQRCAY